MFNTNKYYNLYSNIISNAKSREIFGYTERHHILPRCMGGGNESDNIVKLTPREHFICHRLLVKCTTGQYKHKLAYASWQLGRSLNLKGVNINSRTYEMLKVELSNSMMGRKRKPFTEQARRNMSLSKRGRTYNPSDKQLNHLRDIGQRDKYGANNPFFNKQHSQETKDKISESNRKVYICPFCGKTGKSNSMKRWHFDNCKEKG